MERPMEINGPIVTAKAWSLSDKEQKFDYTYEIATIADLLEQQKIIGAPQLIVIGGPAGTGKTMLAKALVKNLKDSSYINCFDGDGTLEELKHSGFVYVLDEASWLNSDGWERVQFYAELGVALVVFVQSLREVDVTCEHLTYELNRR